MILTGTKDLILCCRSMSNKVFRPLKFLLIILILFTRSILSCNFLFKVELKIMSTARQESLKNRAKCDHNGEKVGKSVATPSTKHAPDPETPHLGRLGTRMFGLFNNDKNKQSQDILI